MEAQYVSEFLGYENKRDITNQRPGVLIVGSRNVVSTDGDTVAIRQGYTTLGTENNDLFPVEGSFEWQKLRIGQLALRSFNDTLQFFWSENIGGDGEWYDVYTSLTNPKLSFTTFYSADEEDDQLLFVQGDNDIYVWSGGVATYASATSTTLTLQGTETWVEKGFLTASTSIGGATTQFDITNPAGTTFRYTFDGTGTDPNITATSVPVGSTIYVQAQNFTAGNNGVFVVTGSGANYFEVTNASGVVESNKTIGTGFIEPFAKQLILDGVTYTYKGGETTTTLTNVTPDPTLGTPTVGDIIVQAVQVRPDLPASGAPFTNDIIRIFRNQVIIGSYNDRTLYISADGDYSDYSPSSPRLPGEGASTTLDAAPVDIIIPNDGRDSETFYISAGTDFWFQLNFTLSSDLQNESIVIVPLKSDTGQAAHNQGAVGFIKNYIAFVSKEPTFDFLGRISDVDTAQSTNISDRIKKDFDAYDFTDCHVRYFKNFSYIALPAESLLLAFNISKNFWEAPWDLPAGRIAVIDGELCIHSNATPSTYKLFQDYNDNGNPINAIARFSYQNWDSRMKYKNYVMATVEGYLTSNTTMDVTVLQDFEGYNGEPTFIVKGTETNIFATNPMGYALGKSALGKKKLAGEVSPLTKKKFRKYKKNVKQNFFEAAWQFSSNAEDQYWEIISFGGDVTLSSNYPIPNIK